MAKDVECCFCRRYVHPAFTTEMLDRVDCQAKEYTILSDLVLFLFTMVPCRGWPCLSIS